jgi:hypothetical protein
MESDHDLISLFEHDLFGKPVPTFPDHALKKKAAWFPKRPFLSYGSLTFNGRFQDVGARGPISRPHPDRKPLLIGSVANWSPNRRGGFPSP